MLSCAEARLLVHFWPSFIWFNWCTPTRLNDARRVSCFANSLTASIYEAMASLGFRRLVLSATRATRFIGQTYIYGPRNVTARQNTVPTASFSTATVTSTPSSTPVTAQEETLKAPSKSAEVLPEANAPDGSTDWSRSYSGLSVQPFSKEAAAILMAPIDPLSIEIKPGK